MHVADRRTRRLSSKEDVRAEFPVKARSPKLRRSELKNPMPKRLLLAPKLQRTKPKAPVAAHLPPALESQPNKSRPPSNRNVIFQFFHVDEHHGVDPNPYRIVKPRAPVLTQQWQLVAHWARSGTSHAWQLSK